MKNFFEIIKNYKVSILVEALAKEVKRIFWREFIRGSFSQDYEDLVVEKIFGKKYIGRYFEIGAYHPIRLSNTYRFYKKGWKGSVVEPRVEVKKLFKRWRKRDEFISAGVNDKKTVLNYYQFLIPAINTFSKSESEKRIREGHKLIRINKIKTVNIKNIIKQRIDFLSIDTEGMDEIILKNWPWKKYQPQVICVENDKQNKVEKVLEELGYKRKWRGKFNSIFEK